MTLSKRASHACSIISTTALAIGIIATIPDTAFAEPASHPAPITDLSKPASTTDSNDRIWSGIDGTRYGDSIRKTARATYTDGGSTPPVMCDVTGDTAVDTIYVNSKTNELTVVPFIPYGSDTDDVTTTLTKQPKALRFTLPQGDEGSWQSSCVKIKRGSKAGLIVARGKHAYVISLDSGSNSTGASTTSGDEPRSATVVGTYEFDGAVRAISATSPSIEEPEFVVAANGHLYLFNEASKTGTIKASEATKNWTIPSDEATTLAPLGEAFKNSAAIGIGLPGKDIVYALNTDLESGPLSDRAVAITGSTSNTTQGASGFGTSIVGISDVNGDDIDDFAVGAPLANNKSGAVAVIYGTQDRPQKIQVQLDSTSDSPVLADQKSNGTLIRQTAHGRIGISLGYVQQYDVDNAGALVIGRPDNEEHPGAVVVSTSALTKNWNTALGLDSIPNSQRVWLASDEGKGGGGTFVATIPTADADQQLSGILTGDSNGKIDVWTVDMRRQHEKTPEVDPLYPAPAIPPQPASIKPINTATAKRWVGEFSNGLGSSIARGSCDVTGDGKPDLITSSPVRSEWKFDVHYEKSTPTHGWLLNVTGQIQIFPNGISGSALPDESVITILGPKHTQDPAVDASVGLSIACIGDVNKDGISDIAVNSHTMGRVWVLFGGDTLRQVDLNNLNPAHGYYVSMPHEMGAAGYQVTRVGDINGDGRDDVGFVVANTPLSRGDKGSYGTALIVAGKSDGKSIDLTEDYNDPNVLWQARTPDGHTLSAFTPIGDVNGDSVQDYVLADFNDFSKKGTIPGKAWVVYGTQGKANLNLQDGVPGYTLSISDDASYRLGAGNSIAPVGDVNHDGIGDFVIGFDGGQIAKTARGGIALVHGSKSPSTTNDNTNVVPTLVNTGGFATRARSTQPNATSSNGVDISVLLGEEAGSGFGWAIDALPKDGLIAVGAWGENKNGAAYLLKAADIPTGITSINDLGTKVKKIDTDAERSRFGRSVAFIGDYLGNSTLAIGADGVIDDAGADEEGYSHAAHIVAYDVNALLDAKTEPSDSGSSPSGPTNGTAGNSAAHGGDSNTQGGSSSQVHVKDLATTGSHLFLLTGLFVALISAGVLIAGRQSKLHRRSE
ncbi:hypothetical protein [Arcanobacterium ihumii]|uniref:hypothetical protein n=1 Tax=Arcanobacterium ihumii TaxID=2138162 RepID=UPI000F51F47D|nr:hypothetical protein [Arcanobacterium ihumii]